MSTLRCALFGLAVAAAVAVSGPRADEAVRFSATPTEYEWRALQDYDDQDPGESLVFPFSRHNPIERSDVYQFPKGVALDLDGGGVEEYALVIHHPAACDVEGCDVLLVEGDMSDDGEVTLRSDGVLRLPLAVFGEARILLLGDSFVFLENARHNFSLMYQGTIDGETVRQFLRNRYGRFTTDRMDSEDVGFASVDLNGDWRPEVIVAVGEYTQCGTQGDCGGGILTPFPEDTQGPYPWRWRDVWPFDTALWPIFEFSVSPDLVRGWRVLRFRTECWAWFDGSYRMFRHATFRVIPVQGCFD